MPEEIDGIVVTIRGDASDLETTINNVAGELSKLERAQGKSGSAGVKSVAEYKKQMTQAENTLKTSRAALNNTKKAYEDNQKSITKNIGSLKSQKSELDKTLALRINEKNLLTEANKHLNKNSTAYKDNQKAIKWVNTEIGSYAEQGKKLTNTIRTQESALAGSKKAYDDALATVDKATKQYDEYEKGLAAVERAEKAQQLQNTGKSMKELGEGIDTVTKPLQYTAAALAAGGVASAKFAIDFEDSFAGVKKTVDGTPEQLDAIKKSIIDMSTVGINGHSAIPMTTDKLNELAAAGGQLGITVDNIADFTEVMAQMETATNLAGEEGAATLARFQNVMGISQSEIRNVGSAIVDLGNNSATTEAEIAAMALRMGKYGNTVGMSAADVLGYSAALSSMGVEAQLGGSAVGRTWLSIESAVAHGGEELQTFAKYSGKSAKEFSEQWNTDSKGAFNGLLKGLKEAGNLTLALEDLGINNTQDIQAMQALVNGYDLVTKSVDRANTAYKENTALQEEFNSKAETTASQLAVAKQNIIEAARSIGETMLPTIKDASVGVADFAKNLAGMDDGTKKFLVGTGTTLIGLGAASKGLASSIKTAGEIKEAYGKLKDNKALQSFVTTLSAIPLPAKLAAAGIAAVGVAGKAAYDAWYDSQYRWSNGLSEGNQKISESLNRYKEISSIQKEIKDLKFAINNPDSSSEQVETAKARLEEIKELLSKEYNLVINADNSNLESAVETAKSFNKTQLQLNMSSQNAKLTGLKDKFDSFNQKEYDNVINEQAKLGELMVKAQEIDKKYSGTSTDTEVLNKRAEALNELGKAYGYSSAEIASGALNVSDLSIRYEELGDKIQKLTDQKNSHDEYAAISTELANWNTELLQMSAAASDAEGVSQALSNIGIYVRNAGLDMSGYAQAAALAMNGIDKLETAWSQAANGDGTALNGIVNDYIRSMKEFGASAEETATGAALIKNGFRTIEEAAQAGELDVVIEQANELAHSVLGIPEEKHIVINADGDVSIIEDEPKYIHSVDAEDMRLD